MTAFLSRFLLCCCLVGGTALAADAAPNPREAQVRAFIDAFNAQDPDAMMQLASPDIEWLSINGTAIATEAAGTTTLRTQMADYFKSCPSCRSRLNDVVVTPQRVVTVEVASWQGKDGPREQRGVAVYEFEADKIRRVYYFPAER